MFGDAFNEQYCGFPLTIQFNLSRSSLRRCHFASEVAVNYLGEAFLFPTDEIRVKPARILTYEEDKDKPTSLNTTQVILVGNWKTQFFSIVVFYKVFL